jgi:hypothetical protein
MIKLTRAILFFGSLLLLLASCRIQPEKRINRRISLRPTDPIPYGAKVAYDGLEYLFPDASISTSDKSPMGLRLGEGKRCYVVIVAEMDPTPAEINALLDFVGEGNHVFLSARRFGDSLLRTLGVKAGYGFPFRMNMDSLQVSIHDPVTGDSLNFSYPGDSFEGWVNDYDPQYATVLGRDRVGRPDFLRFNYKGGGAMFLQFAPLAFSNFFLLHKKNIDYYQRALSYLPMKSTQEVIVDNYYGGSRRGSSALGYILSQPGLRWAFWLLLMLFLVIYLFESKRRQRPIPVITALQNASLDFVKTIGRLYYQRRDNHNLAGKMVMHFQDLVRTRYNLAATALDDDLVQRLAYRTGYEREALSRLVGYMRELPAKAHVPDEELMDLHRQLEAFYKKA